MNLTRRRATFAGAALTAAAVLGDAAALLAPTAARAQGAARPRVSLNIGYIDTSINGVGVIAAANKLDLWSKHGIDAKLVPFTNGPTQIQAMAAGSLDIGYIGGGAIWMPASGQAVIITPNENTFGDFLLARPDSGIKKVEDLRGRKVGVPDSGSGEMILTLALERVGMSMKDIQRIPLDPPNVVSAFVAGQIDVAAIFSPLSDQIRQRLPATVVIANNKDFPNTQFVGAWVASKQAMAAKPEAVQRFLEVWQKVNDYRLKNPKDIVAWASAASGAPASQLQGQVDALEWWPSSQILADNKSGVTRQRFVSMQELFVKLGRLKTPVAPDAFINTDLYNRAMESGKVNAIAAKPRTIGIAILGAGFVADFYLRALRHVRGHEVVAIMARSADKGRALAERYGVPDVETSVADVLQRADVDLVLVALPHDLHVEVVREIAAARKALVCTKPLGRNAAEAAQILRMVREAGVWHGYAETEVFAPGLVKAKQLADSGAIGKVLSVRAREAHGHPHAHARIPERMGGGPLRGLGCHCVAIGRWFLGPDNPPIEVMAWGDRLWREDVKTEDHAVAIVRFQDGRMAQVEVAWTHTAGLDVRNEIHGSQGWIGTDETGSTGVHAFAGRDAGYVLEKAGASTGWMTPVADEPWVYGYHAELAHFVECLQGGRAPRQTLVDGVIDNAVIDAAYRSIQSRAWESVDLSGIEANPT